MDRFDTFVISLILLLATLIPSCSMQKENPGAESKQSTTQAATEEVINETIMAAGSIRGRVIFEGEAPRPQRLMVVKDRDACGNHELYDQRLMINENKGIQNAVVYLTAVNGGKQLSSLGNKFILDQKGCRYQPHVQILPVNIPLEILNDDGILHNFHTFSKKNRPVNMSQPKFRKTMKISFKEPEFIHARCDVHGWMSSWIIVVDHPYYAITDAEGSFTLDDIPPGIYTLNCWQELLGEQTKQLTITEGFEVSATFEFRRESG